MKKLSGASVLLVFLAQSVATAHPGHGLDGGDHSLTHYLSEPLHLISGFGLLAVLLAVGLSWKLLARLKKTRWQHQTAK